MESNLLHALLNAESYLAEGRVHRAHQLIHNAIMMHRSQFAKAVPAAPEPPKSAA
jgi:hypothetical protein